ncbi:MAG: acyl dehydratase [Pseudomonadota bacterium]
MSINAPTLIQHDVMDPARANAMLAALGRTPEVADGDALPPFFHQLYFWSPEPPDRLGRDGHPQVGTGLIPDTGLPRRMWAGGRLAFHRGLCAGIPAERHSRVDMQSRKSGRSGPLAFVTLRHDIRQDRQLCITEWQDLVYREDPDPDAPRPVPPDAPTDADNRREVHFDSTLLFRYSALTFNGHRIHYDLAYAREVEGYAGLVVHGPLLAQLLTFFAEEELGPLAGFGFRATAPLLHSEPAILCSRGSSLWVTGPDGRMCMEATATPAGHAP